MGLIPPKTKWKLMINHHMVFSAGDCRWWFSWGGPWIVPIMGSTWMGSTWLFNMVVQHGCSARGDLVHLVPYCNYLNGPCMCVIIINLKFFSCFSRSQGLRSLRIGGGELPETSHQGAPRSTACVEGPMTVKWMCLVDGSNRAYAHRIHVCYIYIIIYIYIYIR